VSGKLVAGESSEVGVADMVGRTDLFYCRPTVNYERYLRVHAQDFEPLMMQRNCLTPGRVSLHNIFRPI